jgi:hypothetical protein
LNQSRKCQGNCVLSPGVRRLRDGARPGMGTALRGRAFPENVTCGRRRSASRGPMPRTRWNSSIEPKAPKLSRLATIREATTGPIQGSSSMSSELARSRSTGPAGSDTGSGLGRGASAGARSRRRRAEPRVALVVRFRARSAPADSTRAICAASAARVSLLPAGGSPERRRRTAPPSAISAARNSSALRSALVTDYQYHAAAAVSKH